ILCECSYYKSNKEIKQDQELQNFAKDTSTDGSGKVKGFPSKLSTKRSLKKHLKRIIWVLSAQHSALNYPIDHLGALTPNMPTKLYKDPRDGGEHYSIYSLPTAFTGGAQVSVAMTLASMRYDSLFDYGTSLPDRKGGEVVQKYYKYLHTYVKSILQRRNAERFERGYLPYPYLVPGWIANSVHT
ncbi:PREDICTED: arachidonate 5-lipoxygenase-like, partial [Acropora digitifera]|uniref:arachidonate 5-lipoxygenase-like n=1 Tax=Acropora digitifera TaxID=70779 RepID=UPI00077A5A28